MARDTRKCIKDFVRHVESLESEEDPEGNGFNKEYRLIHEEQAKNRRENVFQMTAGKADNNLKKNRYKDILPYDDHRVLLSVIEGEENSDYINASKLMGVKGTGGYIASQGPLASTVNDYWRMIWESNVEIVFMACKIVELGKIKCKQYWNDVDKSDDFGDINVFTISEEEISSDFIRRKFRVTRGSEVREVTQFHYLGWPDHGIPDDPAHIRDLISIMRKTRQNEEAPLLVHCSAGCGRTGAIVAIDFVWTLLEQGRFDETFSLYDLICNFREQRMSMVQTADQYALVNKVLKALCEEWLDQMASHTYVNVELNQNTANANEDEGSAHENSSNVEDTGPGPQIVDLLPPSYQAPQPPTQQGSQSSYENVVILPSQTPVVKTQSSYENVVILPDNKTPVVKSQSGPPAGDESLSSQQKGHEQLLHKTVIQLGGPAATSSAASNNNSATSTTTNNTTSGGKQEVINIVKGNLSKSAPSPSPSSTPLGRTFSVPTPSANVTESRSQTTPLRSATLPASASLSSSSLQIQNGATVPTGTDLEPVYATVNKKRNKDATMPAVTADSVPRPTDIKIIPLHPTTNAASSNQNIATPGSGTPSRSPSGLSASTGDNQAVDCGVDALGRLGSVSSAVSPGATPIPKGSQIPGFGERLPRAKGPVPPPASWVQRH